MIKNNKGITLIALVITVVVLVILAAVAINLTLGNNGVLSRAKDAKNQHNEAEIRERLETILSEYKIDKLSNNADFIEFISDDSRNTGIVLRDQSEDAYIIEFEETYFKISKDGNIITKLDSINIPGVIDINLAINDLISNTEIEVTATVQYEEGKENDEDSIVRDYKYSLYQGDSLINEITSTETIASFTDLTVGNQYTIYVIGHNNGGNSFKSETTYTKLPVYAWNKYEVTPVSTYTISSRGHYYNNDYVSYDPKYDNVSYEFSSYNDMVSRFNTSNGTWSTSGMSVISYNTWDSGMQGKYVLKGGRAYLLSTGGRDGSYTTNGVKQYCFKYNFQTLYYATLASTTYNRVSNTPVDSPVKSNDQNAFTNGQIRNENSHYYEYQLITD